MLFPLGVVAVATPAFAGEAEGKTLFGEARELRQRGKCDDAIVVFRKAYETWPDGLGALRNAAECEEQLGMFASARHDWADLKVAVLQSNQPKYLNPPDATQGWDKDAQQAHDALATRVARVTIKVTGPRPAGMRILVNGKPFGEELLGTELEEDNGRFSVEVQYGGSTPVTKSLTLKDQSRETVELTIPVSSLHTTTPDPDAQSRASTARGMRIGGGIALALGGLSAVAVGVSVGIRQSSLSNVQKACPTLMNCNPNVKPDVNKGQLASTLIAVFGATAGVGIGIGITLIAAAPKSHATDDSAPPPTADQPPPTDAPPPGAAPPPPPPPAALNLGITPLPYGAAIGIGGTF